MGYLFLVDLWLDEKALVLHQLPEVEEFLYFKHCCACETVLPTIITSFGFMIMILLWMSKLIFPVKLSLNLSNAIHVSRISLALKSVTWVGKSSNNLEVWSYSVAVVRSFCGATLRTTLKEWSRPFMCQGVSCFCKSLKTPLTSVATLELVKLATASND